jgi:hypothetical protein
MESGYPREQLSSLDVLLFIFMRLVQVTDFFELSKMISTSNNCAGTK